MGASEAQRCVERALIDRVNILEAPGRQLPVAALPMALHRLPFSTVKKRRHNQP
jgi:hypothetical protein